MMKYWAIRHIPTQRLMPLTNRGYTSWDPTQPTDHPPRLLISYRAATQALRAWLLGEWQPVYEENDSMFGPRSVQIGYSPPTQSDPGRRKPEEMEIVCFSLMEVK